MVILFLSCHTPNKTSYSSKTLQITRIAKNVYLHTSSLSVPGMGKFPCNGVIYVDQKEAIVFDTPTDTAAANELINWLTNTRGCEIKWVVPTHFHVDCLGGLESFHQRKTPSMANNSTIHLAKKEAAVVPRLGFDGNQRLKIGNSGIDLFFPGPGHTRDNIVAYIPRQKVLFGGCLIKEVGAGKGNLADADTNSWSKTVRNVQRQFPGTKTVIPGHGQHGGKELIDYTIHLFEPNEN